MAAAGGAVLNQALKHRGCGQSFDAAGVRLHYRQEGRGAPVLLLHGLGVQSDLNWRWPGVVWSLARNFRVITLDLRGDGLSEKPHGSWAYGAEMVRDAVRLLDHLGIRKAHVAGYSLGGFIALKLAATRSDRLLSAAILGAGWEAPGNPAFDGILERVAADLEAGRGLGPLNVYLEGGWPPPGRLQDLSLRLMTSWINDGRALAGVVRSLPEIMLDETELRRITVPVCGIVGSRDTFRRGAEALTSRLARYELTTIEGADHLTALLHQRTRRALRDFLLRANGKADG
jgi:pimeloyl-ACP methyl ester carboxylesterase